MSDLIGRFLVIQPFHNDKDLHTPDHISNQKHTDNVLHVSIHSCANPAIAISERKQHAESPCAQQPM